MSEKDIKMLNVTIDGQATTVPEGTTIMHAAEKIGIYIPRLCYHPDLSLQGSCRVCIVEVEGMNFFMASCAVEVWDNMVVETNTLAIRQARRDIVELLLENHNSDCQVCERDGNCELQKLAYKLGVRERLFAGEKKEFSVDKSSVSVVRDPSRCILCGRCVRVCAEIQGIHNLDRHGRGFHTLVAPSGAANMDESVCIQCGQCINVCPTAAFIEQSHTDRVWQALEDPEMHVVVQTAPSIRAAIGEGFGLPPGTPATGTMVWALRRLGFDKVFDTDFGADLTIIEESNELINRIQNGGPLPLLTSCSPGWVSFLEKFYPELIPNASSCRSPMSMTSALVKTYYAEKMGLDPDKIFVVAVMPCTAKKFEASRPEHIAENGKPYTDAVLTTRELIWMIKSLGVDYRRITAGDLDPAEVPEAAFDNPLGESTGAGVIFGATGGVMEAALRTAAEKITGKPQGKLDFTEVRGVQGVKEAEIQIGDLTVKIAVSNGLNNAKNLLDAIQSSEKEFHVVEVMACPGGCIGGGGQPYPPATFRAMDPGLLALRAQALYDIDKAQTLRRSHENPSVIKLYEEFIGEVGGEKAHHLLHTHYSARLPRGIR